MEAEAFLEAGKPALVYAGGKLTAWPDCRLDRRRQAALRFTPYEVFVPDPPPRPLPTLDTSLRALGYAPAARPVRPPRFTPPDLNGTPEVRS